MTFDWVNPENRELTHYWSRPWLGRGVILLVLVSLVTPTVVSAVTYEPTVPQPGTIESPANGTTVIAVQGFNDRHRCPRTKE